MKKRAKKMLVLSKKTELCFKLKFIENFAKIDCKNLYF